MGGHTFLSSESSGAAAAVSKSPGDGFADSIMKLNFFKMISDSFVPALKSTKMEWSKPICQQNLASFSILYVWLCERVFELERKVNEKLKGLNAPDGKYSVETRLQTGKGGGAAQEGDPSLVLYTVYAIVGSVDPTLAKMPDYSSANNQSSLVSLNYARCIMRMFITCLRLLKEALGERQSRVFDMVLATEAPNVFAGGFAPSKAPRAQFQMSFAEIPGGAYSTAHVSHMLPSFRRRFLRE
ncbi:hypothetical protein KIW84_060187 [Lathyrus oleraceus]|uniref:Uncharacterized protein n=1 Tax=Pisum sativum TaxID=3888 RepID=A0A9D5A2H4_PEA|nr:hypothetical protein KIW84_060187 [Pisum sativum]